MDNCNALSLNILWAAREHDLGAVGALRVICLHLHFVYTSAYVTFEEYASDPDVIAPKLLDADAFLIVFHRSGSRMIDLTHPT